MSALDLLIALDERGISAHVYRRCAPPPAVSDLAPSRAALPAGAWPAGVTTLADWLAHLARGAVVHALPVVPLYVNLTPEERAAARRVPPTGRPIDVARKVRRGRGMARKVAHA